jgi:NADPH:quinone reductase
MRAIRIHQQGGPEVLTLDSGLEIPEPQAGEAIVRLEHIGVNFIDVYQRSGLYRLPLPFVPGNEGAGTVTAVGSDVHRVKPGDRVGYAMVTGSYAEYARVPGSKLVRLPDDVDTRTAAAIMLQGLTAQYLTRSTFPIKPGDTMAVLAAAGGLGLLLVQVGTHLGARVIGLTSTAEKANQVEAAGADRVVLSTRGDYADQLRALTDGRGVDVIYDSVGKDTFDRSIDSLRPRGMFVLVGQASGPIAPIDVTKIASRSLYFTRPGLGHYIATYEELSERATEVFDWLRRGVFTVKIDCTFPLAQAADAHRRLQSRASVGKILLTVTA